MLEGTHWEACDDIAEPFGRLCLYRDNSKQHPAAPRETPGLFMGWVIDSGIRYRKQVIIADLENFKEGKFNQKMLKQCPELEVHFREKVVFPCAAVCEAHLERSFQKHRISEDPEKRSEQATDPRGCANRRLTGSP